MCLAFGVYSGHFKKQTIFVVDIVVLYQPRAQSTTTREEMCTGEPSGLREASP